MTTFVTQADVLRDLTAAGLHAEVGLYQITARNTLGDIVNIWTSSGEWVISGPYVGGRTAYFESWPDALIAIKHRLTGA